ncbi:hypothetical protein DFP72DRAFT_1073458 [Ephemerocybe angulata]|uniref:Uncharacterized protein n=1 Tax=Ephemerocybe angulata TaxID=980116 RepID=A0A8H6M2M5_9AGAR|nr:hypothetical protein DFP72DRAFT_1078572 [Tulosesus angulatus]KAF6749342.1 hypothetical protein DFP72DRAFT_1073458 [Tulosesus angulatus]
MDTDGLLQPKYLAGCKCSRPLRLISPQPALPPSVSPITVYNDVVVVPRPVAHSPPADLQVSVDMPRSPNRGLLSATRRADYLVAAICFIGVFLEHGDIDAFWTQCYLRLLILHGDPPSPPGVDRWVFTSLHRMHVIITIYSLAARHRVSSLTPRAWTNQEWDAHRDRLREQLRHILFNEIMLERYLNRPITMTEEPMYQTLYGAHVPRHELRQLAPPRRT